MTAVQKLKVLIADDEPDAIAIVGRKVAEAGFEVVKASDGAEAWEMILSARPDIIVLDLNMPHKDGFSILRDLKTSAALAGTWRPVIIVSARHELDDMRQGMDLEADHYLTKPCSAEEIVNAVRLMAALIPLRNS